MGFFIGKSGVQRYVEDDLVYESPAKKHCFGSIDTAWDDQIDVEPVDSGFEKCPHCSYEGTRKQVHMHKVKKHLG